MNFEFDEWGWWNDAYESVTLYGAADGDRFVLAFACEAIAEFLGVPNEPREVQYAFNQNKAFMEEIARDIVESGKLDYDRTRILESEQLLPYFENRAAIARA